MHTHRMVGFVPQQLVTGTYCYEDVEVVSFREDKDGLVLAEVVVLRRKRNRKFVLPATFLRVYPTLRSAAPQCAGSTPARDASEQRQLNYSDSSSDESD